MSATPTERLQEIGAKLPPPPKPAGTYSSVVVDGAHAYVAGQIVLQDGAILYPGLVDRDVPPETAKGVAMRASLQALSALEEALGTLDRVRRIVRVTVYVASVPTFHRQHEVANGATEILTQIFGDGGRAARVAIGVAVLPLNAPVEVEMVVALTEV
jgi:enamine deaminase RidA (YjgF/YER057c/UK114 family)